MVIDTSVLLAVFFEETHYEWAIKQMNDHARELRMSTVNLTETLIHLRDRQPQISTKIEEKFLYSGIRFIAPDIQQSQIATDARLKFPLNLGDCFVYALAVQRKNAPF